MYFGFFKRIETLNNQGVLVCSNNFVDKYNDFFLIQTLRIIE